MPEPPRVRRLAGPYAYGAMTVLVFAWFLPILWTGFTKSDVPNLPAWLRHQHRVACLFTHSVRSWSTYHAELNTVSDDESSWKELDEPRYFAMTVFGFRSRMHRILEDSFDAPRGMARTDAVARFILERRLELEPDAPALRAVRFVRVRHPVDELVEQTGCFVRPALLDVSPERRTEFGEARFDGKAPYRNERELKRLRGRKPG